MRNLKKLVVGWLVAVLVISAVAVLGTSSGDELLGRVNVKRTNLQDLDHDGLTNQEEANIGTDPMNPNTDGDNLSDSQEITQGCDPLRQDGPGQGETFLSLCHIGGYDYDNDGLRGQYYSMSETDFGTSEVNPDTDGDGISDGREVGVYPVAVVGENTLGDPLDPCDPNPLASACVQKRANRR